MILFVTNGTYCSSHCHRHLAQRWHHSSALCLQTYWSLFWGLPYWTERQNRTWGPLFLWAMILALEILSTKGNFQDSGTTFLFSLLLMIYSSHFATQKNLFTFKFHYSFLKNTVYVSYSLHKLLPMVCSDGQSSNQCLIKNLGSAPSGRIVRGH